MPPQGIVYWGVIAVIAGGLMAGLMIAWRRYWRSRLDANPQWPKVYVLGTYSPVLSRLKYWRQQLGQVRWPWLTRVWASVSGSRPSQPGAPAQATPAAPAAAPPAASAVPPEPLTAEAPVKSEIGSHAAPSAAGGASATRVETHQIALTTTEPASTASGERVVHVQLTLDVPEGTSVRVTVEASPGAAPRVVSLAPESLPLAPGTTRASPIREALKSRWALGQATLARWRAAWRGRAISAGTVFFVLSLLIYAITRFWALDRFPIYFFADEANLTVMADELISHGFHGTDGLLLPLYFDAAGNRWTPVLPVYFQALALTLFGRSIAISRATSALVTLLGVAAAGLSLKWIFKLRYWWTSVLLLGIMPAWFLHSRTAFETASTTALFAGFLLCYLLYRERSPRYIYAAVALGAATFYSYSNAQVVIVTAAGLLFLSDLRYHLKQWWHVLGGLLLAAVLSWPLVSFSLKHPDALQTHLHAVDSYVFKAFSLTQKIALYLQKYAQGLSPQYWFWPNNVDLVRHQMDSMGHISLALLPLVALGLVVSLVQFRSARHRAVVLAALAAPAGAGLLNIGITRVLTFVIPAGMLAALGLDFILVRLKRVPYWVLAGGAFVILSAASLSLLRTALVDGPLWFRDYGLYGMQYGAKQLFEDAIPPYLAREPDILVGVSSSWANGTDNFLRFFFTPAQRSHIQMLDVDYFLFDKRNLTPNIMLVTTPAEYERARASPKFQGVTVEQVVPYPDGTPGFYFIRLAYSDAADAIFKAEREERRKPVVEQFELDGQMVTVSHSLFGAGQLKDVFDDDPFSLVRGLEANPLVFDLTFSQPRPVTELSADFGTMPNFTVRVLLYAPDASEPVVVSTTYLDSPRDPHYDLPLPGAPLLVARVRIEVKDNAAGDTAQIHVRTLKLR